MRDWPGFDGPLIHLPDPLHATTTIVVLTAVLTPRYRVMSVLPRTDCPYQVHVADLHGVLAQFGFDHAVLAAEGLSCVTALLLSAWFPERVGALALIDPRFDAPEDQTLLARSLRDCPPVRPAVACRIVEVAGSTPTLVGVLEQLLTDHPLP